MGSDPIINNLYNEIKLLREKTNLLASLILDKPERIKSMNILGKVIDLGLANTASKARDYLVRNKIVDAKFLQDIENLDILNKTNKPLVE